VRGRSAACTSGNLPLQLSTEDSLPESCHMSHALQEANCTFKVKASAIEQGSGSEWKSVPCYGLPPRLADEVTAQLSSPNQTPHLSSLDELFALYNRSNPITAWTVPVFFSTCSVHHLLLTDSFFQHLEKKRAFIAKVRICRQMHTLSFRILRVSVGSGTLDGTARG
jgi:hypothetical protein